MEVGLGQIERAGAATGAGVGQAFGPTTVVTTHTEDGADIAVSLAPSVVSRRLLKSELSWEAIAREAVSPTDRLWVASFWNYGRGCRIPDWVVTCIDESSLKYFAPETGGLKKDSVF